MTRPAFPETDAWIAKVTMSNDIGFRKTWLVFCPGVKLRCPERLAAWLVKRLP